MVRRGSGVRGLTLIELLIVIAIIGILTVSIAVVGIRIGPGAREKAARADIQRISMALDAYYEQFRRYPPDTGFGLELEPFENPGTYDPGSLWRYLVKEVYCERTRMTYGPYLPNWPKSKLKEYRDPLNNGEIAYFLSDPWGNAYGFIGDPRRVMHNRGGFDLFSCGPDGVTACNDGKDNTGDGVTDVPALNPVTRLQPPVIGLGPLDNRAYNGIDDTENGIIDDASEFGPEARLNGNIGDDINNWTSF